MSWNWNQFWKRSIPGLTCRADRRADLRADLGADLRADLGLIFGLSFGLIVGVVSGFAGGFTDTVKVGKAYPNQGIKLSGKNSLTAFLVTWLIVGLIVG